MIERWSYVVAVPTSLFDDPELWRQLNDGDIEPDYGDELMLCLMCNSSDTQSQGSSSANTSDGMICYERWHCKECGYAWDDDFDCPDESPDESLDDELPWSVQMMGDEAYIDDPPELTAYDEAADKCGASSSGCDLVGTPYCEFECPFSNDIEV